MLTCLCGLPLSENSPNECKRITLKEAGWVRRDRSSYGVPHELWVDPSEERERYGKYVSLELAWKRFLKEIGIICSTIQKSG